MEIHQKNNILISDIRLFRGILIHHRRILIVGHTALNTALNAKQYTASPSDTHRRLHRFDTPLLIPLSTIFNLTNTTLNTTSSDYGSDHNTKKDWKPRDRGNKKGKEEQTYTKTGTIATQISVPNRHIIGTIATHISVLNLTQNGHNERLGHANQWYLTHTWGIWALEKRNLSIGKEKVIFKSAKSHIKIEIIPPITRSPITR